MTFLALERRCHFEFRKQGKPDDHGFRTLICPSYPCGYYDDTQSTEPSALRKLSWRCSSIGASPTRPTIDFSSMIKNECASTPPKRS
ncbi:hypothetical protein I312_100985 [Cryptococcus bacillisporus CA1280]|uniref:uncharacterized protein n=1 Tax=Cryptococcus bacillisporus CA1280 TaxID=1296109 RepID=UPI00336777FA